MRNYTDAIKMTFRDVLVNKLYFRQLPTFDYISQVYTTSLKILNRRML